MPDHLLDEELISYLDGELERDEQEKARIHLDSCWECRTKLLIFQRGIEKFLKVKQENLSPELPPLGPAVDLFRERLTAHSTRTGVHSYFRLKMPKQLRNFFRKLIVPFRMGDSVSGTTRLLMRVTAGLLITSLVFVFVFLSSRFNNVSARELLERSINSHSETLNTTDQPVVRQRLKIKRINSKSSGNEAEVIRETWDDTVHSRMRQAVLTSDQNPTSAPPQAALPELERIFQINRLDIRRPLSPAAYRIWSESITSKTETVTKSVRGEGLEILTLETVPTGPVATDHITNARFIVRAADWHPIELSLRIKAADEGEIEYRIIETDFEVVSLKTLDPAFFSDQTIQPVVTPSVTIAKVTPSASPGLTPDLQVAVNTNTNPNPVPSDSTMPPATTAMEVEALNLLHKINADISEQINVIRTADGKLMVQGLVETEKRKSEVLEALAPLAKNPAIKINIQTIDEAARELAKQKQKSPGTDANNVSRVEVDNKAQLPVEGELREYFEKRGGNTDEQIRQFASRMINRSQAALFQASAMNRMANRFTAEQLRTMEPEARTKWLTIIKNYAAAVKRETSNLRQELALVFFPGGGIEAAEVSINNDADLIHAIRQLSDLAADNDRLVRSAFTLSSGNLSISAIKTPQFRRSLGSVEKLAGAIEKAR